MAGVIWAYGARAGGSALGTVEIGILYAFMSYMARVHALLKEAETPPAADAGRVRRGEIDIEDLTFAHRSGHDVLHGLDLRMPAGSFHGIVGHTGSGKTTLLSLLLRFYPAPAGSIRIDGVPLDAIGEDHFRASVGLVPQDPFLLAASARENIAMGRALTDARIEAAARAAQAHEFIARAGGRSAAR